MVKTKTKTKNLAATCKKLDVFPPQVGCDTMKLVGLLLPLANGHDFAH